MSPIFLAVVAVVLLSGAVTRYRPDRLALVAGIVAALAGILGASLVLPEVNGTASVSLVATLGVIAVLLAVAGSVQAEMRRHRRSARRTGPDGS